MKFHIIDEVEHGWSCMVVNVVHDSILLQFSSNGYFISVAIYYIMVGRKGFGIWCMFVGQHIILFLQTIYQA